MESWREDMKKKQKIIGGCIVGVLLLVLIVFIGLNIISQNNTEVESIISMMDSQIEKEKEFTIEGHTLDNPNVIVNPYGNSPLTALVIFETSEETEVSVTIPGKDKNTTYTHTFEESKEHYLPIYGLYAGKTNKITVSADARQLRQLLQQPQARDQAHQRRSRPPDGRGRQGGELDLQIRKAL